MEGENILFHLGIDPCQDCWVASFFSALEDIYFPHLSLPHGENSPPHRQF